MPTPAPAKVKVHVAVPDKKSDKHSDQLPAHTPVETPVAGPAQETSESSSCPLLNSPDPSAPGFLPPITGYEFELNHSGNRQELRRQKQWAQTQLFSCNENNRFKHTQTTACVVAVNGHIIGPYRAESLRCFGTNPEVAGLRVTMTVYEDYPDTKDNKAGGIFAAVHKSGKDTCGDMPVYRRATLVLKHQIIVPHSARNSFNHLHHQSHNHNQQRQDFTPGILPPSSGTANMPLMTGFVDGLARRNSLAASVASTRTRTNTGHSTASSTGGASTISTAPSTSHRFSVSSTRSDASMASVPSTSHQHQHQYQHQQGRRYLFATTTIPLQSGVSARPGYRPVEAGHAAERLRKWGGQPDKGVFGNSWLVHMSIEPGHVRHEVDCKMMEQVQRLAGHRHSVGGYSGITPHATAGDSMPVHTMRMVNENMAKLVAREGTLSVMLSNHITQKRIARQCPDLVAMWVMAQENL